jgi:hypothetical protein
MTNRHQLDANDLAISGQQNLGAIAGQQNTRGLQEQQKCRNEHDAYLARKADYDEAYWKNQAEGNKRMQYAHPQDEMRVEQRIRIDLDERKRQQEEINKRMKDAMNSMPMGTGPAANTHPQPVLGSHGQRGEDAPKETTVDAILTERGKRYGLFTGHAKITQGLKETIKHHLDIRAKLLAPDQQEALDMICHKIGRIINGDPDYDDSWVDIAGYAQLVADRLQGKVR